MAHVPRRDELTQDEIDRVFDAAGSEFVDYTLAGQILEDIDSDEDAQALRRMQRMKRNSANGLLAERVIAGFLSDKLTLKREFTESELAIFRLGVLSMAQAADGRVSLAPDAVSIEVSAIPSYHDDEETTG